MAAGEHEFECFPLRFDLLLFADRIGGGPALDLGIDVILDPLLLRTHQVLKTAGHEDLEAAEPGVFDADDFAGKRWNLCVL